jgi:hypothetical protein
MSCTSVKSNYVNYNNKSLTRLSKDDKEIIDYIHLLEARKYNNIVTLDSFNKSISTHSRRIVNNWLLRLGFDENVEYTVMLAQQYLDRFVCVSGGKVNLPNYQLYAVAAYSIAYKYNDDEVEDMSNRSISGSRVEFLVDMTDNAFTTSQFIKAENEILYTLKYKLVTITIEEIVTFILGDIIIKDFLLKSLLDILLKISIIHEISIIYKPSIIAHSIVHIFISLEKLSKSSYNFIRTFYNLDKYIKCLKNLKELLYKSISFQNIKGCDDFYECYKIELKEIKNNYFIVLEDIP